MVTVERWIDINSEEFKKIENASDVKLYTIKAVEHKVVLPDVNGNLYFGKTPLHVEIGGKLVGLRHAVKAWN